MAAYSLSSSDLTSVNLAKKPIENFQKSVVIIPHVADI